MNEKAEMLSNSKTLQIPFAHILWRNDTPYSPAFQDIYFTSGQGLAESRTVFLEANGLPTRWHQLEDGESFTIFETGFGTGLNFLVTLEAWHSYLAARSYQIAPHLTFISVEKYPLHATDFVRIAQQHPQFSPYTTQIVDQLYPLLSPGLHRLDFNHHASLLLWIGDLQEVEQIPLAKQPSAQPLINAWFLDGFAPARNPEMWSKSWFNYMAQHSGNGSTFGTFTAATMIGKHLSDSGFVVKKTKGFGYKRERLYGYWDKVLKVEQIPLAKQASAQPLIDDQPKDNQLKYAKGYSLTSNKTQKILIVGGGLSGCLTARALLKRVTKNSRPATEITLIEQRAALAQSASGMTQIALDIRLSSDFNMASQFYLAAYQFALRYYRQLNQDLGLLNYQLMDQPDKQPIHPLPGQSNAYWHPVGLLQLADNPAEQARQEKFYRIQQPNRELCYPVDQTTTSQLAGIQLKAAGLYFPHGGYLTPQALCKAVGQEIAAQGKLLLECTLSELLWNQQQQTWLALDQQHQPLGEFDVVILCNAYQAKQLSYTNFLPLKAIKGQATGIREGDALSSESSLALQSLQPEKPKLRCVLSHPGNLFPPSSDNLTWLGSSYELNETSEQLDHNKLRDNISAWADIAPDFYQQLLNNFNQHTIKGKAAVRCTTPDYLPVTGPVPIATQYVQDFALLRKNAKAVRAKPVSYYPGLYLNTGHGSRGCCSIPLCAELIAAMIDKETYGLSNHLLPYLAAERFIAKDLIQRKI